MSGLDGFGAKLMRGDGASPETFTEIADPTDISGPGLSRDTIEVTSHGSPNQYKEYVGGLKDGGEVSVDINYQPALHDLLVDDLDDDAPRNYELHFPDPDLTVWAFAAVMTGFEPDAPHDDKLAATVTFQVSGKPVIRVGG